MCEHLKVTDQQGIRKVCLVMSFCRSMWYYQNQQPRSKLTRYEWAEKIILRGKPRGIKPHNVSKRDDRPVMAKLPELAKQTAYQRNHHINSIRPVLLLN